MPRPTTRRRWASVVALLVVGILASGACAGPTAPVPSPTSSAPTAPPKPPVLATHAGLNGTGRELRETKAGPDGLLRINTPAIIGQLTRLHVNTYVYPV